MAYRFIQHPIVETGPTKRKNTIQLNQLKINQHIYSIQYMHGTTKEQRFLHISYFSPCCLVPQARFELALGGFLDHCLYQLRYQGIYVFNIPQPGFCSILTLIFATTRTNKASVPQSCLCCRLYLGSLTKYQSKFLHNTKVNFSYSHLPPVPSFLTFARQVGC